MFFCLWCIVAHAATKQQIRVHLRTAPPAKSGPMTSLYVCTHMDAQVWKKEPGISTVASTGKWRSVCQKDVASAPQRPGGYSFNTIV